MRIQRSESIVETRASAWRASELDDRARKERDREREKEKNGEKGRDERREREGRKVSVRWRGPIDPLSRTAVAG